MEVAKMQKKQERLHNSTSQTNDWRHAGCSMSIFYIQPSQSLQDCHHSVSIVERKGRVKQLHTLDNWRKKLQVKKEENNLTWIHEGQWH